MKELAKEMVDLRKRFEEPVLSNSGNGKPNTSQEKQDYNREFEVIAHGFERDSDAEDVEKIMNDLIKEMKLETRIQRFSRFRIQRPSESFHSKPFPQVRLLQKKLAIKWRNPRVASCWVSKTIRP